MQDNPERFMLSVNKIQKKERQPERLPFQDNPVSSDEIVYFENIPEKLSNNE